MERLLQISVQEQLQFLVIDCSQLSLRFIQAEEFISKAQKNEIYNFKIIGRQLVCCDGQSKQIYIDYKPGADKKLIDTLQLGKDIQVKIQGSQRFIQLSKFRQPIEKQIDPRTCIHIVAKVEEPKVYIAQDSLGVARVMKESDIVNLVKQRKIKAVNARVVNNSLRQIKGSFFKVIYTKTPIQATQAPATQAPATQAPATQSPATQAPATQAQAPVIQEQEQSKNWGYLLNYAKFMPKTYIKTQTLGKNQYTRFDRLGIAVDFEEAYRNQPYSYIMNGNNQYNMLNYIEKLHVAININNRYAKKVADKALEKEIYIEKPKFRLILSQSLRRTIDRLLREQASLQGQEKWNKHTSLQGQEKWNKHTSLQGQEKWNKHYKRSIKLDKKCDEKHMVTSILLDQIEYRIRNDNYIRQKLSTVSKDVKHILSNGEYHQAVILAVYIDNLQSRKNEPDKISDQTVAVAQAIRIHYLLNIAFYNRLKRDIEISKLIKLIKQDTRELTMFIQHSTLEKCKTEKYVQVQCELDSYKQQYVSDYSVYTYQRKLETTPELKFSYMDKNNTVWNTTVTSRTAIINNMQDNELDSEFELYNNISNLKKINESTYVICEVVKKIGNKASDPKVDTRIVLLAKRHGITDIIYIPIEIMLQYKEYLENNMSAFNVELKQIIIQNKVYYIVKQSTAVICLAPNDTNFNGAYQQCLETDQKTYTQMNTDRPLVFSYYGQDQNHIVYKENEFRATSEYTYSKPVQYRAEVRQDIQSLIEQYLDA